MRHRVYQTSVNSPNAAASRMMEYTFIDSKTPLEFLTENGSIRIPQFINQKPLPGPG